MFALGGIVGLTGVGGGSLVYACTLPIPKPTFFKTGSWAGLNDWENVLPPFYDMAYRMLGAEVNPKLCAGDEMLQRVAQKINREDEFHATKVSIFFAREGQNPGRPCPIRISAVKAPSERHVCTAARA